MLVLEPALPAPWQYYADRAIEAHQGRADCFGLGREEQLCETLRVIEQKIPFDDACRKRLDRLPQNRSKKHFRLLQRLADIARATKLVEPSSLELRDEVEGVASGRRCNNSA